MLSRTGRRSPLMPAGTVEHHHGVGVRASLAADFDQMLRHRLTADSGHDDCGADGALRTQSRVGAGRGGIARCPDIPNYAAAALPNRSTPAAALLEREGGYKRFSVRDLG